MVVIAVAGGTGALGRTIVEALVAKGTNEVKILARKFNPTLEKELGVSILVVDYADVAATTRILEENKIHTVISTINMLPSDGSTPNEVELIQAADASKTTKRFIPSDFGILHTNEYYILPSTSPSNLMLTFLATTTASPPPPTKLSPAPPWRRQPRSNTRASSAATLSITTSCPR